MPRGDETQLPEVEQVAAKKRERKGKNQGRRWTGDGIPSVSSRWFWCGNRMPFVEFVILTNRSVKMRCELSDLWKIYRSHEQRGRHKHNILYSSLIYFSFQDREDHVNSCMTENNRMIRNMSNLILRVCFLLIPITQLFKMTLTCSLLLTLPRDLPVQYLLQRYNKITKLDWAHIIERCIENAGMLRHHNPKIVRHSA